MTARATLSPAAVGTRLPPTTHRWTPTDAILYALGVGARPPAERHLLDEHVGPAVLPTYALVANWWAVKDLRAILDLGASPIVHAAQSLSLERSVASSGEVSVAAEVTALWDTGKHAVIEVTSTGTDANGPLFHASSQTMVLGEGGFGGTRPASTAPAPHRAPDGVHADEVRPEQAAIYRLSGDRNPLHIDPAAARRFGFDDVFLHGLCTLGFAARALINVAGNGDPASLTSISCRFAKPVKLASELRTEIWRDGAGPVRFQTLQGDVVSLSSGTATLTGC
ncbi:MaoC/PaaZ C-terminal domain-containing protein [Mycolicibacterium elephantis]|uniref:MaoC/PaaZ C-terminal domain-containing protein n=1 Tax=Mycolicibacterium elephantis TaxID=81858 RepID=UPI003A840C1F